MAAAATSGRAVRVLIVEDGLAAVHLIRSCLDRAMGPSGQRVTEAWALDHAAALRSTPEDLDVALVDATRHPNDRVVDPSVPLCAGLEVADRLAATDPSCRVVGYSVRARDPVLNIAFRELANVHAVYDMEGLVDHLAEALWSDEPIHQVSPPTEDDFRSLGLLPGARLWEAVKVARRRADTWEAVAATQPHLGIEKRTREHLNIHLAPLLPTPEPVTYRHHVAVLRAVCGFTPVPPGGPTP